MTVAHEPDLRAEDLTPEQYPLALAAIEAQRDRTARIELAVVAAVALATLLIDAVIVPGRLAEAAALKGGLVVLPATAALISGPGRGPLRRILLAVALIGLGAATTTIASWSPPPDNVFHMLGTVLILGIATPVLPFTPRQSAAFVAAYVLVTAALWVFGGHLLLSSAPGLAVLGITGIAAWIVGLRMWRLQTQNLILADLRRHRVEELSRANRDLQKLASHDPLTGLSNRRHAAELFAEHYGKGGLPGQDHVAVFLVDIDHFKGFNDRWGHQTGDVCLRAVSDTIAHVARARGGIAARYGGEEFVVVARTQGRLEAEQMAEQLRVDIERIELANDTGQDTAVCTVSVGVAVHDGASQPVLAKLLERSDAALYEAKRAGRNRTVMAG